MLAWRRDDDAWGIVLRAECRGVPLEVEQQVCAPFDWIARVDTSGPSPVLDWATDPRAAMQRAERAARQAVGT